MGYKISAFLILLLISSLISERLVSAQLNTLAGKGQWYSGKNINSPYELGLVGQYAFPFKRQTLAQDQLNLGAWFGFNEVIWAQPITNFLKYEVSFSLPKLESQLFIDLNCDDKKCRSLRLSPDPFKPSGIYSVQHDGEFLERTLISFIPTLGEHQVRAEKEGAEYQLYFDEKKVARLSLDLPVFPVRFRNGGKNVMIKEVHVVKADQTEVNLDFKRRFSWTYFLTSLLLQLFFLALVCLGFKAKPLLFFMILSVQVYILIAVSGLFLLDRYVWSPSYYTKDWNPTWGKHGDFASMLEDVRSHFADLLSPEAVSSWKYRNAGSQLQWLPGRKFKNWSNHSFTPDAFQIIEPPQPAKFVSNPRRDFFKKNFKLAFLGGSQAWGAGASSGEKTMAYLFTQGLQKKLGRGVSAINFSRCGAKIEGYGDRVNHLIEFKPNLLILHFGANDHGTETVKFIKDFEALIELMKINSIPVLISIEARGLEYLRNAHSKHDLIIEFAREHGLPTFDLHNHFLRLEDQLSGMHWLDAAHFTDFGQRKAAEAILASTALKDVLKSARKPQY